MNEIMQYLQDIEITEEKRQKGKIKHRLSEVLMLVLFAMLANAEYWEEMEEFGHYHEALLCQYLPFENGIPSHDTIQRVMGMIDPTITSQLSTIWKDLVETEEENKLYKLLAIDGKTIKGNRSDTQKAAHIITCYHVMSQTCLAQLMVHEKTNEITAVPQLLNLLRIEGFTITADAMSTQVEIVKKIRKKKGNYLLAVKENQGTLYEDIKTYFDDPKLQKTLKDEEHHKETIEGAHSQVETRKYYQSTEVTWLTKNHPKRWKDLNSIAMVETSCERKDGAVSIERRYYISSLLLDIDYVSACIRGHWKIESMHWELDVVFDEDANKTMNQVAAQNLNNMRKLCLSILKRWKIGKRMSGRRKRFQLSMGFPKYIEELFSL